MQEKIDFVVLWVDDQDSNWLDDKNKYYNEIYGKSLNHDSRYRDWNIFHFWFRGIEKFAPWVNKIHLVTAGHYPKWLDLNHPKLNLVKHEDFIPKEYLPTFSTRPIELNLHRIPGLADKFVYFNDDIHVVNTISPDDFFNGDYPLDIGVSTPIVASGYNSVFFNVMKVVNKHNLNRNPFKEKPFNWFSLKYGFLFLRNFLTFPWKGNIGFYFFHAPTSYIKKDFEKVWLIESELLDTVCKNKFRTEFDVNHQVFRFFRLANNDFKPSKLHKIAKDLELKDSKLSFNKIKNYSIICFNDNEKTNFDLLQPDIYSFLNDRFEDKSLFEIDF